MCTKLRQLYKIESSTKLRGSSKTKQKKWGALFPMRARHDHHDNAYLKEFFVVKILTFSFIRSFYPIVSILPERYETTRFELATTEGDEPF